MIDAIQEGWGWTGIRSVETVETSAFGNVLVRDKDDRYWRICPEELSCEIVAKDKNEFQALLADAEFQRDWEMGELVAAAKKAIGLPPDGRCYCLKVPGVLGGKYSIENVGTITIDELIRASGDMGKQIKGLPDGTQVRLRVVNP